MDVFDAAMLGPLSSLCPKLIAHVRCELYSRLNERHVSFHAGDVLGVLTINDFSASIGKVDGLSFMCAHKSIKTVKVDALIVQAMYRVYYRAFSVACVIAIF
jgi:hypothetical protein